MRRPAVLSALVFTASVAGPAAARGEETPATPSYAVVGPFGPATASFPWHAAFSPDGRWVGFSDGHTAYVGVWDARSGKRAWTLGGRESGGTHRIAFSADSTRMAFVSAGRLRVLRLEGGAWRDDASIPLGVDPGIWASWSPGRLDLAGDASTAVLTADRRAWRVHVGTSRVESLSGGEKDVVATFLLPGGDVAFSRSGAFSTTILRADGRTDGAKGVLLEASPDGRRWLVATDPTRFDLDFLGEETPSRLALEIRDPSTNRALGSFVLSGKRKAGDSFGHRLLLQGQFSPDGRVLATVEGTGEIVLRDASTGVPIQRVREYAHLPYPMGVAFDADGSRMITGGRRPYGQDLPDILLWARATRGDPREGLESK